MVLKNKYSEQSIFYCLLAVLGLLYLVQDINFPGSYQGGDGLRHYLISRYSWKHPELLLDLWGKPFFTLVSSPFSQGGLLGIKIFNLICGLLTCNIIYRIAVKMKMPYAILSVVILGFTPIYFFSINSGFTEFLFGLILVYAIHEYIKRNFLWSTVLISFLPFVRSEGYLLLPLFFIMLLIRRKYYIIPLLATANLIYSTIGYFHFGDFFWLHTQNPYDGHMADIYGHGPWLHFFKRYDWIWGLPLSLLLLGGLPVIATRLLKRMVSEKEFGLEEYILVYGSAFAYFFSHVIFWKFGLFNSLGLERVMTAIVPLTALMCVRGFEIIPFIIKQRKIQLVTFGALIIIIIINPFKKPFYPLQLDPEEQLVLKVKDWFLSSDLKNKNYKKYYLHPYLPEAISFDAFDVNITGELWGLYPTIKTYGYGAIPDNTLVFWDGHFGPNEGGIPIDTLLHDKQFKLIKSFFPDQPFLVLGDHPFEIHVFQKIHPESNPVDTLGDNKYDFETEEGIANAQPIISGFAYSGNKSCRLNNTSEYSPTIIKKVNTMKDPGSITCINFSFRVSSKEKIEAKAVLSFHKEDKQTGWYSFPVKYEGTSSGKWEEIGGRWLIDADALKDADFLKIYIWNSEKQNFYTDDFNVTYMNQCYN